MRSVSCLCGDTPQLSKAVAWYALRVWPLWWCPNFWLFQDSQCWLPWWKWDTRSVFHWHCMGQCCCSLVMKLTGLPLLLLYFHHTETYFENAVNNGSFSKHGVSWQSILNESWGYWAITLQCLFIVQLMSSEYSATKFYSQFNWPVISHPNTFGWWVVMQLRYSLVKQQMNMTTGEATAV